MESMTASDLELAEKASNGDRAAFHLILERHYDMIYRVAYRFTGYAEDAEDIAQDVCVSLVDKLKSFHGKSAITTWLYRITANTCMDFHRKNKSGRNMEKSFLEFEKNSRAEHAEESAKVAWLYREIAKLDADLKSTALLVLAEDLTHAEAAKVLECAESTVSWRMHEIRKILKTRMDSYHG